MRAYEAEKWCFALQHFRSLIQTQSRSFVCLDPILVKRI